LGGGAYTVAQPVAVEATAAEAATNIRTLLEELDLSCYFCATNQERESVRNKTTAPRSPAFRRFSLYRFSAETRETLSKLTGYRHRS
jgi:hypothetical protein